MAPDPAGPRLTRRRLLAGGAGAVVLGGAAAAAAGTRERWPWRGHPDWFVPDAPEGRTRLETLDSRAMGGPVDLWTAVPAGYGDGAGLPVVVVLHGASASAASFGGFGFGHFVSAAAAAGTPFVLAGTDDGPAGWLPAGDADPPAMLREELPAWLGDRGFDAGRRVVWAWSRGGYGALRFALDEPAWARAWALFSPAVAADDPALADLGPLAGVPLGVWCGTEDGFCDDVREVVGRLPTPPEVARYDPGRHTRTFWNDHTLEAFAWLGGHLA